MSEHSLSFESIQQTLVKDSEFDFQKRNNNKKFVLHHPYFVTRSLNWYVVLPDFLNNLVSQGEGLKV